MNFTLVSKTSLWVPIFLRSVQHYQGSLAPDQDWKGPFAIYPSVLPLLTPYPGNPSPTEAEVATCGQVRVTLREQQAVIVGLSLRGSWAVGMSIRANITPYPRAWEDSSRGLHQDKAQSWGCILKWCAMEYQSHLQATLTQGFEEGSSKTQA